MPVPVPSGGVASGSSTSAPAPVPAPAPVVPSTQGQVPVPVPSGGVASGLPFAIGAFGHSTERTEALQDKLGRPLDVITVSPDRKTWDEIFSLWWMDKEPAGFKGTLDVAPPLWPTEEGSLDEAAKGAYNAQWEKLGRTIAAKYPDAYVRPGWEFNIPNHPWRATEENADQWVQAFRHASESLKKGGPNLRITWNPNGGVGGSLKDATRVYPGDAYVDVIGVDQYGWSYDTWEKVLNGAGGLNYWANFAREHGKRLSFPEWGVHRGDEGSGDDPEFVRNMVGFFNANRDVLDFAAYFDETNPYIQNSIAAGQAPKAGEALKASLDAVAGSSASAAPREATPQPRSSVSAEQASPPAPAEGAQERETESSSRGRGPEPRAVAPIESASTSQPDAPLSVVAGGSGPIAVSESTGEWTDGQGVSTSYRLWAPESGTRARGLVVYLDGDRQHGVKNPGDPYALGGGQGIVAQAAQRGYATLAILAPGGFSWWENEAGPRNAVYVRDLVSRISEQLGTSEVQWVGFSGGSQLITKYLLPIYQGALPPGGALVMGGGGAPARVEGIPSGYPIRWHTGTEDTGTRSEPYNALADAQEGAEAYARAGADVRMETPSGVDHDGIGGTMGATLARVLPAA